MNPNRIPIVARRVAAGPSLTGDGEPAKDSDSLVAIDNAIDNIIAGIMVIDEALPQIKGESVPQKAALAAVKETMDGAIKPYMADIAKAMEVFGG